MSNTQDCGVIASAKSQAEAKKYPLNLLRSRDFPHTLKAYQSRLDKDESKLFSAKASQVITWDLITPQDTIHTKRQFNHAKDLENALEHIASDPYRRFIFLQSLSSRDPLKCSRQQMALLLTHHQVTASFLEFIFTFKRREVPHSFTSFRYENHLSPHHQQPRLESMGRSGIRMQHCFNILGIEQNSEGTWLQRQTAAYHSFDLIKGRTLWIIIKGDATMQNRVESATEQSAQKPTPVLNNVQESFGQTLEDHLLILQWSVENWGPYTESFEQSCRDLSGVPAHAPVQALVDDYSANRIADRIKNPWFGQQSRQHTQDSQADPQPEPLLRRLSSKLTTRSTKRKNTGLLGWSDGGPPTPKMKHLRLDDLISSEKLQELSRLDKRISEAISMIGQNKRVLAEVKSHYQDLLSSSSFKLHFSEDALESCKQYTLEFVQEIRRLEGDLDNYQSNLKTMLRGIEKTETLCNGILQYQNMRAAEYFAMSSEDSTDIMRIWTGQMHQKTMSMHVITVFTLIFLPGTFVATIFSSGILSFGGDGDSGFGSDLGDWKVRLAGVKLYLVVCLPLMTLTLFAWIMAYCFARSGRNSAGGSEGRIDESKGVMNEKTAQMV